MSLVKVLYAIVLIAITNQPVMAANAFKKLSCSAVISDRVSILNRDAMYFVWKTSASETFPILRNLASKDISDSLLLAYGSVDMEVKIPLNSCQFAGEPRGNFSCKVTKDVAVTLKAKTSAYSDDKPDVLKGQLSHLNITSLHTGKANSSYLQFALEGKSINGQGQQALFRVKTDRFATYYHRTDGVRQNPDCLVDGGFVVIEE